MGKISLEKSHKGKKHIFSFSFLQNLFDFFFLRLRFFFRLVNLCSLKVLKFGLNFFSYVFLNLFILHYIICIICIVFWV